MMEEELMSALPYDTIEDDGHKPQSILAFNKAIVVTIFASSTLISTLKNH